MDGFYRKIGTNLYIVPGDTGWNDGDSVHRSTAALDGLTGVQLLALGLARCTVVSGNVPALPLLARWTWTADGLDITIIHQPRGIDELRGIFWNRIVKHLPPKNAPEAEAQVLLDKLSQCATRADVIAMLPDILDHETVAPVRWAARHP
jgi:hypothetical protein